MNEIRFWRRGRRFAGGAVMTALALILVLPGVGTVESVKAAEVTCECASTYDRVVQAGVLKAGVRFDYPPVGYLDASGEPAGFGPDLAREFAKRLGVKVEFVENTSKTRIPLLLNGSMDMEIGPTSPTVKREEVVDFSIPYFWDSGAVLVREGESTDPKDYGPPKAVGMTQGSFFKDLFSAIHSDAQFTTFQEYTDAVVALERGKVDAVLINRSNALAFAKKVPGLKVGDSFVQLPLGITLRQNDSKWRNWVNWTLQRMWQDGTYKAIYVKTFGEEPTFYMWSPTQLQPGL